MLGASIRWGIFGPQSAISAPQGITTLFASSLLLFPIVSCLYGVGIGRSVVSAKRAERKIHGVERFVYVHQYALLL